jgi:hypothetical protein
MLRVQYVALVRNFEPPTNMTLEYRLECAVSWPTAGRHGTDNAATRVCAFTRSIPRELVPTRIATQQHRSFPPETNYGQ